MFELLLLALALSMDAFAISLSLGATRNDKQRAASPLLIAGYFGVFHGIMPFAGYLLGANIFVWIEALSKWICFGILVFIGAKAVYEYLYGQANTERKNLVGQAAIFALSLTVSIDAFATGFTLVLLPVPALVSCALIGTVAFIFSVVGDRLGRQGSVLLQDKATLVGGIILIFVAFNILLS